jgi:16S rRNA (guanine527-N7)-methyltransferase
LVPRSTWNLGLTEVNVPRGTLLSESLQRARRLLESGLSELGTELRPGAVDALIDLAELLAAWSQRMNLTAHREPESIVSRLILDAAALERVLPEAGRIVDLGSGAGFPGLPLAVLRPDAEIVLVEAREKRHHFQRAAIRRAALENVLPVRGRAEEVTPLPSPLVVAQALAAPTNALELAIPWAAVGGWIALPGSPSSEDPTPHPGIVASGRLVYRVPGEGPERTVWLGRRLG